MINTIKFNQQKIKLIKSRKNKYMRLSINNAGEIRLSVPFHTQPVQISKFLKKQQNWIKKTIYTLPKIQKIKIETGEFITILEKKYKLIIKNNKQNENIKIKINKDKKYITLYLNKNFSRKQIIEKLKLYLREFARDIITQRVNEICKQENIVYNRISIREQKSRWGSCSNKGNLNFNWKIILAPKNIFNYILTHEIAHLIEHNHSKDFWNIVEKIHPSFENDKKWLKTNAYKLELR